MRNIENNNVPLAPSIPTTEDHTYTEKETKIAEDRAKNPQSVQSKASSTPTSMNSNSVDNFDLNRRGGVDSLLSTPNVEGKYQAVAEMKKPLDKGNLSLSEQQEAEQSKYNAINSIKKNYENQTITPQSGIFKRGKEKKLNEAVSEYTGKEKDSKIKLQEIESNLRSVQTSLNNVLEQISSVTEKRESNNDRTAEGIKHWEEKIQKEPIQSIEYPHSITNALISTENHKDRERVWGIIDQKQNEILNRTDVETSGKVSKAPKELIYIDLINHGFVKLPMTEEVITNNSKRIETIMRKWDVINKVAESMGVEVDEDIASKLFAAGEKERTSGGYRSGANHVRNLQRKNYTALDGFNNENDYGKSFKNDFYHVLREKYDNAIKENKISEDSESQNIINTIAFLTPSFESSGADSDWFISISKQLLADKLTNKEGKVFNVRPPIAEKFYTVTKQQQLPGNSETITEYNNLIQKSTVLLKPVWDRLARMDIQNQKRDALNVELNE